MEDCPRSFTGIVILDPKNKVIRALDMFIGGYAQGVKIESCFLPHVLLLSVESNYVAEVHKKLKEERIEILSIVAFGTHTVYKTVADVEWRAKIHDI
jgi:hypothetical protein